MFRSLARLHRRSRPARRRPLECPRCDADALCPIDWEPFGDDHWMMWMRCGGCGGWLQALVHNRDAATIDRELDRHQARIAARVAEYESERMAADVDAFVSLLRHDLVDAGDFAR